ncbi:MAG: hypothetical protein IJ617_04155 [Oscillospiraceae bacterium]|nr:hypothetical protein [Oscillospiraceae bacterium]
MSMMEQIVANAKFAKNAVLELEPQLAYGKRLWEYFHLRPTAEGVTIVSNHPRYPMSGADAAAGELKEKLLAVESEVLPLLTAEDPSHVLGEVVERFGFRRSARDLEEAGQARQREVHIESSFISGMIRGGAEYAGVEFLASELSLPDPDGYPDCIEVVGYRDGTVYLFATKKGRDTAIYGQLAALREKFNARRADYEKLLSAYPRTACRHNVTVHDVRCVAVMKYAAGTGTDWQALSSANGVDTWFHETALSFRKLGGK